MKYVKLSDTAYYPAPECYLAYSEIEIECSLCPVSPQCKEKKETVEK